MNVLEVLSLIVLVGLAWLWFDSMQVRALALRAATAACDAEGLQLLDQAISITKLGLARNDDGRLLIRRIYGFDFSDSGNDRRRGSVAMLGQELQIVNVGMRLTAPTVTLH